MEVSKFHLKWDMKMRLSELFLTDAMSDVTFLVDEPAQRYPCHKLILGLGSQVFKAMLYGKLAEKGDIRVPDVSKAGFTILLQYLYTGKCSIQNQSEALEAAYASKKYLIKDLFKACESYLLTNAVISPDTVFHLYEEASFLEMERLQRHCLRFISRNSKRILRSKTFLKASKGSFEAMLQLDVMDVESETEIIEALWLWGKEQCRVSGVEDSVDETRKKTKDLLKHVRFLSMKRSELEEILDKFQILDTADHLSVMWSMSMPKVCGSSNLKSSIICDISRTRSVNNSSRIELPTEYRYDGNLTTFTTKDLTVSASVVVAGPQVTLLGFVVAFKPIPCYSSTHRNLGFEILAHNLTNGSHASTKSYHEATEDDKEESRQVVLLDDYIELSEGDRTTLSVKMAAEGVRLMQCMRSEFSCHIGSTTVSVKFDSKGTFFPVKEILCVAKGGEVN